MPVKLIENNLQTNLPTTRWFYRASFSGEPTNDDEHDNEGQAKNGNANCGIEKIDSGKNSNPTIPQTPREIPGLEFSFFFSVSDGKRQKLVLTQKQMILTSKQHAEHQFAGRNTQPRMPEHQKRSNQKRTKKLYQHKTKTQLYMLPHASFG